MSGAAALKALRLKQLVIAPGEYHHGGSPLSSRCSRGNGWRRRCTTRVPAAAAATARAQDRRVRWRPRLRKCTAYYAAHAARQQRYSRVLQTQRFTTASV
eukprot:2807947-Pleurochrysis_carterae.AAC.2